MSGFFKKLFNRITGKKEDEAAPEVVVEQAALPAPEPVPEPVVEEIVAPKPVAKAKAKAKAPAPKKPEPKKVVAKSKPPVKKPEAPKAKAKPVKAPPAKVEPVKKPVAQKVIEKKPAPPKKPSSKKPSSKKPSSNKPSVEKIKVAPPPSPPEPLVVEAPPRPPLPEPVKLQTAAVVAERKGWFSRLTQGLSKSSKTITGSITSIFTKRKLDKETLQELEDTLIQADLGLAVAERIIAEVSRGRFDKEIDPEEVKQILASEVAKVLKPVEVPFNFGSEKPFVILVVGVNGSGKTTTIGKLGSIAAGEGFKVKFAA